MKWFKFYGQDYLSDPKMLMLSACERSCWITLLSYGSVNDNGMITFLDEEQLMAQAGISPMHEEWETTKGILKKLETLQMITLDNGVITICNWTKRQEMSLSGYERVKRYRERHKNDNANDNTMITPEEKRRDKNRRRERDSSSYLVKIPEEDITEFTTRFDVSRKQLVSKAESLKLYCEAKGRQYKNYKSFLLNALKKDFKERANIPKNFKPEIIEISEEQRKANLEKLAQMKSKLFRK